MIPYGAATWKEIHFTGFTPNVEERLPWIDIYLKLHFEEGTELPEGLTDPSGLAICNADRKIVQLIVLDEGCDSEFQFTPGEKEQIVRYLLDSGLATGYIEERAE
ncbi:hypothetical protein [Paenibacillus sp. J2TS4]|uniref:hypothetical protein n=1 Tax=Paenibacillus sp. J2TS4 TaxID=2807194 RepID=UPI001B1D8900|nr:hypothetical protein [Paenibacillus sp. J2TS4]GIP32846.1 hypothetical protein J2TS4_20560 [Paenibacillus sp. J2TS4]